MFAQKACNTPRNMWGREAVSSHRQVPAILPGDVNIDTRRSKFDWRIGVDIERIGIIDVMTRD